MALTLKEIMEARGRLSEKESRSQSKETISLEELRKMMGVSKESDQQTDTSIKAETVQVQDNPVQREIEKTNEILSKDEQASTHLDSIEGVLTKTLVENKKQTETLKKLDLSGRGNKLSAEQIVEGERNQTEIVSLLKKIEKNTSDIEPEEAQKKKPGVEIGGIGTALAIALGGLVGSIQGYVKAIVVMNKALYKAISSFSVSVLKFFPNVRKFIASIEAGLSMWFDLFKSSFIDFVQKGIKIFNDLKGTFISAFTKLLDTKIAKDIISVITKSLEVIKNVFTKLLDTQIVKDIINLVPKSIAAVKDFFSSISSAFSTIREISGPIGRVLDSIEDGSKSFFEFFKTIGSKFKAFTKLFGAVAKLFKVIALPITIIMTAIDTIMGAIEGFKKDGIIGGIAGAIKGLVNSIIMAPLDLLKDIVSWVAGAFGFDKVEQMLDSFSFEDIFSSFVDAIFSPIETLKKLFDGAVAAIQDISIPEIGFTIPIIDKKVSIGPFYPFKSDTQSVAPAPTSAAEPPKTAKVETEPVQKSISDSADQRLAKRDNGTAPGVLSERTKTSEQVLQPQEIKITQEPSAQREKPNNYDAAYKKYKDQGASDFGADKLAKRDASVSPGAVPESASTSEIAPVAPTDAAAVYNKSADNAKSAVTNQNGAPPVVISAPVQNTNVNNNQNITMPKPTRNSDSGFNSYLKNNAVFV